MVSLQYYVSYVGHMSAGSLLKIDKNCMKRCQLNELNINRDWNKMTERCQLFWMYIYTKCASIVLGLGMISLCISRHESRIFYSIPLFSEKSFVLIALVHSSNYRKEEKMVKKEKNRYSWRREII